MKNGIKGTFGSTLFFGLAVCALGFLIYADVLTAGFVFDDHSHLDFSLLQNADLPDLWQLYNTRFFVGLTFALNYLWGQTHPFGYHLVNLFIHLLNSLLVFSLVRLLFRTPVLIRDVLEKDAMLLAAGSALIFLCHPIQTEAVSFLTQRYTLLGVTFYLMTLIFYLRARMQKTSWAAAFVAMSLGCFSKELIVTVPFMLLACEFFFFSEPRSELKRRLVGILPFFLLAAGVPFVLSLGSSGAIIGLKEQVSGRMIDGNYFLTELNVLRTYLRLLVLPVGQNVCYDYPLAKSFFEPGTMFSAALLAGLFVFGCRQFFRRRLISFAVCWFFVTTSVEALHATVVNRAVICEHWLYLAMAGFGMGLVYFLRLGLKDTRIFKLLILMTVVVLSVSTFQRNQVWQNDIVLWQDAVKKSPRSFVAHVLMGESYQRNGSYLEAVEHFQLAASLFKSRPGDRRDAVILGGVYDRLGIAGAAAGKSELAQEAFFQALLQDPHNGRASHNLALFFYRQGRYAQAAGYFEQAMRLQGGYPSAYYYLGLSYAALGEKDLARANLLEAFKRYRVSPESEKLRTIEEKLRSL